MTSFQNGPIAETREYVPIKNDYAARVELEGKGPLFVSGMRRRNDSYMYAHAHSASALLSL